MNPNEVTGIVLAGGRSKRMGEDKSLMRLNGKTMIEFSIDALKPLCSKVIISSKQSIYDFTGCQVWHDEIENQAPIIGIYSCLKRSETDVNIILSCDVPLISKELLEFLLANSADHEITVPIHDNGMIEPLCGIYKKSATGILKVCIDEGNFSMQDCILKASNILVKIDNLSMYFPGNQFKNINTPADFKDLSTQNIG
jgi:molybdopterin-guanine dinucleotide biosynthesis protein A